ncbi:acyltransferase family protein [Microbulbifer marinus]|uniref:Peptidoglycan/LPS O-acetylase OafA/YrhL, contains acyltransferase and SGNH-hydrolase domains n=1 Tax=Microbulbifer marinus TaxID=658218 RepID=A0A1H3X4J8_9GAMM|nr:acyltransferase family protein [Microbulbifer marinus]SDZ94190.1 Peptidoglycan/LPS O-acetylase OafA/YrhL, contains acyltransferase and SGNH-hydrolase domains [Microbulbifer marinus]
MSNIGYRRDIDGLRAFAVLPVLFAHAGLPGFSGGFVGVDVFFVISGYLITGILLREIGEDRFSLTSFYERRARRILPALFAVLIVSLAVGWFVLPPEPLKELAQSVLATLLFVSNIWFWRSTEDYFGSDADWQPLLHTWSLSVEEQFYLGFPLLLCLLASRGRSLTLLAVAGISALSLGLSIWATKAQPFANYFLTPTRVWELGLGALIALAGVARVRRVWLLELAAGAGLAMILAAVFLYDASTPFPGMAALLPCIGAAALIWVGGQRQTAAGRLLSWRPFVAVGLISYSLYLWHWPVLVLFRLLHGGAELPLALALQAVALSLVLAWLSWGFVEAPFRRPTPQGFSRRGLVRTLGAVATLVVSVALVINVNKGMPSRLPESLFATYQNAIKRTPEQRRCMGLSPAEGLCEFGVAAEDGASVDYLLWGDSHAGAFLPGFERWLQDRKRRGVAAVKSACAPLLGVVRMEMGASHGCDTFNAQVMEMLEQRDDLNTVILVARWALVVEGTRSPGESGPPAVMAPASGQSARQIAAAGDPASHNFELVASGLADTVARIRATGREVVIVEGLPEIPFSVPMAIVSAEFVGAQLQAAPTREDVEARNRRANAIFDALAEEFQVQRQSLVPELCRPRCQIQASGMPLYRDDDHLSAFGSERLVPDLLDRIPAG